MTFVLDASVAMSWCLDERQALRTQPVLTAFETRRATVPAMWPVEIANALAVSERRGRADDSSIARFLDRIRDLPIDLDLEGVQQALARVLPLARVQQVSAYDACYLELAVRLGAPLATLDAAMTRAAERLGIALMPLPPASGT